jgi:hypothetical protein
MREYELLQATLSEECVRQRLQLVVRHVNNSQARCWPEQLCGNAGQPVVGEKQYLQANVLSTVMHSAQNGSHNCPNASRITEWISIKGGIGHVQKELLAL